MSMPIQSALEFAAILLRAPLIPGRKEPNAIADLEASSKAFVTAYFEGAKRGLPRPLCSRLERAIYDGALGLLLAQVQASVSIDQAIHGLQSRAASIRDGKSGRLATIAGMAKRLQSGQAGDDIYRATMLSIIRLSSAPELPAEIIGSGPASPLSGVVDAMLHQGDAICEFLRSRYGTDRETAPDIMASLFTNAGLLLVARGPSGGLLSEGMVTDECRSIVKTFNGLHSTETSAARTNPPQPASEKQAFPSQQRPVDDRISRDTSTPERRLTRQDPPIAPGTHSQGGGGQPVGPTERPQGQAPERRRFGAIRGFI